MLYFATPSMYRGSRIAHHSRLEQRRSLTLYDNIAVGSLATSTAEYIIPDTASTVATFLTVSRICEIPMNQE